MNRQTLITVIVVVVLGGAGYLWYWYSPQAPGEEISSVLPGARLVELRRLKEIKFDTSLFEDQFFQSLVVYPSMPALDVTPGRSNPFEAF